MTETDLPDTPPAERIPLWDTPTHPIVSLCPLCGKGAVVALTKKASDGTAFVCHPLNGGCNVGFRKD